MKRTVSASFALVLLSLSMGFARAEIFTAGESFSFSFTALPYLGPGSVGGGSRGGDAKFNVVLGENLASDAAINLQMFETSSFTQFLTSITYYGAGGTFYEATPVALGHWNDLEGAVRLTVVSGEIDLEGISVSKVVNNSFLYGEDVVVPEPSCLALSCASAVLYGMRLRRR